MHMKCAELRKKEVKIYLLMRQKIGAARESGLTSKMDKKNSFYFFDLPKFFLSSSNRRAKNQVS